MRRAERVAAVKAGLRAELDRQLATGDGPEKDPKMGLLRELIAGNEDELWLAGGTSTADSEALMQQLTASPKAAPNSRSLVIVLPPGPVAESIEADGGASYRLHAEAAASAEAPRETRDEAQILLESTLPAAEDGFASPRPSMEAHRSGGRASIGSALGDVGQSFRGSRESARGSVLWRSFRNSFREGGNQPRKRRWSVFLVIAYPLHLPDDLKPSRLEIHEHYISLAAWLHTTKTCKIHALCRWGRARRTGDSRCQCAVCRSA